MGGAVNFIREMKLGKESKVVVLLPDSSRNYMSKFMADDWMEENGFATAEDLS
jgi:cystathionine beta-synthase